MVNNAEKKYFFFNDSKADSQDILDSNYTKLDGMVYKLENYDSSGKRIPTVEYKYYDIHVDTTWLSGIYDRRMIKEITKLDRVKTVIERKYTLNSNSPDINGLPRYGQVKNSNNRTITEYTLFAHERMEYDSLKGSANILDQPCLKLVLENYAIQQAPTSSWYNSIVSDTIRSATAITWSTNHNDSGRWAPNKVFAWNVDKENSGKPKINFTGFNFSAPDTNTNWRFISAITRYNKYGQVLETERTGVGSNKVYSSRIYRSDIAQPVADIVNSRYGECAVFTCDYNKNDSVGGTLYYDIENGWVNSGNANVTSAKRHFGQKTVRVINSKGPLKRVYGIDTSTDYIFSAWVYPNNSNAITLGAIADGTGKNLSISKAGLNTGTWQIIKGIVYGDSLYSVNNYLEIWIGNNGGPSSDFYVDDIRFYPRKALVSTTYYETLWEKPVLTVDANNNPGATIDYKSMNVMTKNDMTGNNIASIDAEGSVSNYTGNIGFHPADALKINIYHDEIWERPKIFMNNDPGGRIEYDDFGRPWKWYKMAHNGNDSLVVRKEYHLSGFQQ